MDAVPHRMSYVMYTLYATVFTPGLTAVRRKKEHIRPMYYVNFRHSSVPEFLGKVRYISHLFFDKRRKKFAQPFHVLLFSFGIIFILKCMNFRKLR